MDELVIAVVGSRNWLWRFPGSLVELRGEWVDGNAPIHLDTDGGSRDVLGPVTPCDSLPEHVDATIRLEGARATLEIDGVVLEAGDLDAAQPAWTPRPPDPIIAAKERVLRCWRACVRTGGSVSENPDFDALRNLEPEVRKRLVDRVSALRDRDTNGWAGQIDAIHDLEQAVRVGDDAYVYLDPVLGVLRGVLEPGHEGQPGRAGPALPQTSAPTTDDARHALRIFHIAGLLQHYDVTPISDETNASHWDRLFEGTEWRSGSSTRLVAFAVDATGSAYCLWEGVAGPNPPVALLGSEGELAILADSLVDLVRAFAKGARWDGHGMTAAQGEDVGPATRQAREMDRARIAASLDAAWGPEERTLEQLTASSRGHSTAFLRWCEGVRGR